MRLWAAVGTRDQLQFEEHVRFLFLTLLDPSSSFFAVGSSAWFGAVSFSVSIDFGSLASDITDRWLLCYCFSS